MSIEKKHLIIGTAICVIVVACFLSFNKKQNIDNTSSKVDNSIETVNSSKDNTITDNNISIENRSKENASLENNKTEIQKAHIELDDNNIKNVNLFNSDSSAVIPLSTIGIISTLPQNIQEKVSAIADTNSIYMTKLNNDKLLIITDNPQNIRHCIEFTEISLKNGHQIKTTLGYNDKMKDSDNDIWEYDNITKLPTRHSKYNSDGDIEFVETWHYDDSPIKYEMKDSEGHVLSMRKETLDNGSNLRIEHLLYDKAGNTKINVSTIYDGADVKRFTYYNADKPADGGSVFAEYENGLKTKETVYSNDLKVENSYTAEYHNGEREGITIWDKNNKELQKLVPKETAQAL